MSFFAWIQLIVYKNWSIHWRFRFYFEIPMISLDFGIFIRPPPPPPYTHTISPVSVYGGQLRIKIYCRLHWFCKMTRFVEFVLSILFWKDWLTPKPFKTCMLLKRITTSWYTSFLGTVSYVLMNQMELINRSLVMSCDIMLVSYVEANNKTCTFH